MKRDKYDIVMSNLIRSRANWTCERCLTYYPEGHRGGLEHSHCWGRRRHSVRWAPDNGISLCTGCHRLVGSNKDIHQELAESIFGKERCDEIKLQANSIRRWKPWEKSALYASQKSELRRMETLRDEGFDGRIEFTLEN